MCGNITEDSLEINVSQFDTYSQEELDEKIASLRLEITQKEKRVQMLGFPGTYKPLEKDMICYPKKSMGGIDRDGIAYRFGCSGHGMGNS